MRRWGVVLVVAGIAVVGALLLWKRTRPVSPAATPERGATHVGRAPVDDGEGRMFPTWVGETGARPRRVAGRVSFRGAPVPGARVRMEPAELDTDVVPPRVEVTDGNGSFDFGPQPIARYNVTAEAPGRSAAGARIDLAARHGDPPPERLELRLGDCRATVSGTVRDSSGGVVAGARVRLSFRESVALALTDANGAYVLCIDPGPGWMSVAADAYAQRQARVNAYGPTRVDVVMTPEVLVEGLVVNGADGAPVAGARVSATPIAWGAQSIGTQAVTDEDGRFSLRGLAAGPWRLAAQAERRATVSPVDLVARLGATPPITLRLEPMVVFRGQVLRGDRPVPAARVHGYNDDSVSASATTNDDGRFVLDSFPPGHVRFVVVGHKIVGRREVKLVAGMPETQVHVEPLAIVRGRVVKNGAPAADAHVEAAQTSPERWYRAHAHSRADGSFEVEGLMAGEYEVSATDVTQTAFGRGPRLVLADGEVREGVVVDLDLSGSISGVVVDRSGAPVPGAYVRVLWAEGNDQGLATTAADGTFTAGGLSGGGAYAPEVRPRADAPMPLRPVTPFSPIPVRDGKDSVTGVRLAVDLERLAIAGRVVTDSGGPVADAEVSAAFLEQPQNESFEMAVTAADGRFRADGLVSGRYRLVARTPSGLFAHADNVAAGSEDVLLRLPRPGRIRGKLVGFPPAVRVTVAGPGQSWRPALDGGGSFTLEDMVPGDYQVAAQADEAWVTENTSVTAGSTAEVTLRWHGLATIEGRLTLFGSGAPVAGGMCDFGRRGAAVETDAGGRFRGSVAAEQDVHVNCVAHGLGENQRTLSQRVRARAGAVVEVRAEIIAIPDPPGDPGLTLAPGETRLVNVRAGGPAEAAGLRADDQIVALDTYRAAEYAPYTLFALLERAPGTRVSITYVRDGREQTTELVLGAPPK